MIIHLTIEQNVVRAKNCKTYLTTYLSNKLLDLPLRNKSKRGPRKMPHCFSSSKSNNQQSENVII